MRSLVPWLAAWVALAAAWISPGACALGAGLPADGDGAAWAMERVEVADHPPYEGLIESEDDAWITMIQIQRPRGQAMHLVVRSIDRRGVISIERLDPAQRTKLRGEIEQFRNHAAIDARRMEAVALEPLDAEGNHYLHYRGKWFTLDSTADAASTRRVVVRAEQIFAAYRQILPPRISPPQPPRLIVFGSVAQYQAFLARLHLDIQNRACFLEDKNLVVTGGELSRLAAVMARTTAQNDQFRKDLKELETHLSDRLGELAARLRKDGLSGNETARLLGMERHKFDDQRKKILDDLARSDREIARLFNENTRQTFVRLYHESFHAYLRNYVYPRQGFDVPYWLNEGLAVMFEAGVLEGNAMRIDAPNAASLRALKDDLAGGEPLPLAKLLEAGQGQFIETDKTHASDRYYAHAWGLVYYLVFEKGWLGSDSLDRYVRPVGPGQTQLGRFERLVQQPSADFEKAWHAYVETLRSRP